MADISLRKARTIIRRSLEKGRDLGLQPLAVAVLDSGGNLIAFEREDEAAPGRFNIAHAKAYGAIMLGMPGRAQQARAEEQPYFMAAISGVFNGQIVPVPGGVLVRNKKGVIIGAVGVTGDSSDNDAEAALAGIAATGLIGEA